MPLWQITAQVQGQTPRRAQDAGWSGSRQVPTFYVDAASDTEAKTKARDIILSALAYDTAITCTDVLLPTWDDTTGAPRQVHFHPGLDGPCHCPTPGTIPVPAGVTGTRAGNFNTTVYEATCRYCQSPIWRQAMGYRWYYDTTRAELQPDTGVARCWKAPAPGHHQPDTTEGNTSAD